MKHLYLIYQVEDKRINFFFFFLTLKERKKKKQPKTSGYKSNIVSAFELQALNIWASCCSL